MLLTELSVLFYFTHKVTLPLLNLVKINSQKDVVRIFPKLYTDLKEDKLDTLNDHKVIYRHVPVKAPTNETEHLKLEGCALMLLNLCCCNMEGSTVFLKLLNVEARATLLHFFSSAELENLPTNNIPS